MDTKRPTTLSGPVTLANALTRWPHAIWLIDLPGSPNQLVASDEFERALRRYHAWTRPWEKELTQFPAVWHSFITAPVTWHGPNVVIQLPGMTGWVTRLMAASIDPRGEPSISELLHDLTDCMVIDRNPEDSDQPSQQTWLGGPTPAARLRAGTSIMAGSSFRCWSRFLSQPAAVEDGILYGLDLPTGSRFYLAHVVPIKARA